MDDLYTGLGWAVALGTIGAFVALIVYLGVYRLEIGKIREHERGETERKKLDIEAREDRRLIEELMTAVDIVGTHNSLSARRELRTRVRASWEAVGRGDG